MRLYPIVLSVLALSAPAFAADGAARVTATKADGVTLEKLKAATSPIEIARYESEGKKVSVRCAGSTGRLVCETWNADTNQILAASSDVKLCKDGNDYALVSTKMGNARIVIPQGLYLGDPASVTVCGG